MPLPSNGVQWVPSEWSKIYNRYAEFAAWYSSDLLGLSNIYSEAFNMPYTQGNAARVNKVKREIKYSLHVPLAADISQTNANMLFGESPNITIPEANVKSAVAGAVAAQDRLHTILQQGNFSSRLLEAAESSSALGGVFLKINWDRDFLSFPVISVVQADAALPVFKWGFLQEITFWKIVLDDKNRVYRLLEHHTKGTIQNALYKGTATNLGNNVPLTTLTETADLEETISTGIEDICVRYIPNMRPNRLYRGSALGQSDYADCIPLLDALNQVYTSWIRDIRLGQARIIVPEMWMQKNKNDEFAFNVDEEVFTALDIDPLSASANPMTNVQFQIRVDEHRQTAMDFINRIITAAGYSPQSFGLVINGAAESGTALNVRERKSMITQSKKQGFYKTAVEDILGMLLQIDKLVFNTPKVEIFKPNLEFRESLAFDINQAATTVDTLNRATALSTMTKVQMIHPDWTKDQIEAEVALILADSGIVGAVTENLPV